MNEKVYKSMSRIGGSSITLGIIILVTGAAAGILMIIQGAKLLRQKSELTF
ncbi:MAG: hypothetical protein PHC41_14650 [Lachnospiraceae bacterium]|jgi:hypothetical protein|nr:hypothetical protein [Lachnospiraceae bacterium]MDD3617446.1 hypothetical protein [Lachnospiraceae bacterium]